MFGATMREPLLLMGYGIFYFTLNSWSYCCTAGTHRREISLWAQLFQDNLPQSCRTFTATTTPGDYYMRCYYYYTITNKEPQVTVSRSHSWRTESPADKFHY